MAAAALRVQGGARLRADLKRAGVAVEDLKAAHKKVAELVRDEAVRDAPRRSGRLAADVRPAGTQREAVVRLGRKSVPYAGPIHWGWKKRNIAAQPFVWAAAQSTETRWTRTYLDALETIIDAIGD